jgi:predicted nucleic acid-binding protein
MTLFVDSSIWYAAVDGADLSHRRATEVLCGGELLVTSDHVLAETWSLIRRRIHHDAAERFWEGLRDGVAGIEPIGLADLEAAWAIGHLFPDQGFSLVDRTSFALMERLGVTRAASFDVHFAVYRYGRARDRAFDIVR